MKMRQSLVALLGSVVLAATLSAQPMPPMLSVARVQVRADRMAEYLEVQKKITEAYKKGNAPMRIVLRGTIGNPNEVVLISAMDNYAQREDMANSAVGKAMTPQEWTALYARRDQCTVSVRTTIERTLPDISVSPATSPLPKMVREIRTRVRPGKQNEYMALIKSEVIPTLKKMDVKSYRVRQVQYGGSRAEFSAVSPMDKWAELDAMAGKMEAAMGAEAYRKYQDKIGSLVTGSEYTIYTVVADASYRNQ